MTFIIIGLIAGLIAFAAGRRLGSAVIAFVVVTLLSYIGLPTLAWGFDGLPSLLMVVGLIVAGYDIAAEPSRSGVTGGAIVAAVGVVVLFGGQIISSTMFRSAEYRALIGEVQESTYSTDTQPLDPSKVRVVDEAMAVRLAEKRLGENTALGSQVRIGEMAIQQVADELFWVAPLNHSGFFKWISNRSGTPGYVMVSATNERDVRLVQSVNGEPLKIRYNSGAWFGDEPNRYVYNHGYSTKGITDYTFEIDDTGRPYWVITRFKKRISFRGNDPVGVIVMDAQTGELNEYGIDEAPVWVDRIQPEAMVMDQLEAWGRNVHGWWLQNPSCRDCVIPTPGASLIYGEDGRSYWYTGMSGTGDDQATVGFVLVDARTKETRFYKQPGASEVAAMRSAEGSVQEKGYHATAPILYNVSGLPTYFMTLKDDAGLVKMYAFVNVESYQMVGIGEEVSGALRSYRRSVASRGDAVAPDGAVEHLYLEGEVMRLQAESRQGETYYYLLVQGAEDKAFVGSSGVSVELPLTREGDLVSIGYEDGGSAIVDIMSFDNAALNFQRTRQQEVVEEREMRIRDQQAATQASRNADALWEGLSPEDKASLVQQRLN